MRLRRIHLVAFLAAVFAAVALADSSPISAGQPPEPRPPPRSRTRLCTDTWPTPGNPGTPPPPSIVVQVRADPGVYGSFYASLSVRSPEGAVCIALEVKRPEEGRWGIVRAGLVDEGQRPFTDLHIGFSGNCFRAFAANESGRSQYSGEVCIGELPDPP